MLQVREELNIPIMSIITMVNDKYNHRINYKKAWGGKQLVVDKVYGNWITTYSVNFQYLWQSWYMQISIMLLWLMQSIMMRWSTPLYAIIFLVSKGNDGWLTTSTPGTFNRRYLSGGKIRKKVPYCMDVQTTTNITSVMP